MKTGQNKLLTNRLNSIIFSYDSIGYSVGVNGTILFTSNGGAINSIDEDIQPNGVYLFQNYPNPFNPSTKIDFRIEEFGPVTLKVYDLLGNEVSTLVNEEKPAGEYSTKFLAEELASGMYFYQLTTQRFTKTKKMLLIR